MYTTSTQKNWCFILYKIHNCVGVNFVKINSFYLFIFFSFFIRKNRITYNLYIAIQKFNNILTRNGGTNKEKKMSTKK